MLGVWSLSKLLVLMRRILRFNEVLLLVARHDIHSSHKVMMLQPRLIIMRCICRATFHLSVINRRLFGVSGSRHQSCLLGLLLALKLRRRAGLIQGHVWGSDHTFAIRAAEDRISIRWLYIPRYALSVVLSFAAPLGRVEMWVVSRLACRSLLVLKMLVVSIMRFGSLSDDLQLRLVQDCQSLRIIVHRWSIWKKLLPCDTFLLPSIIFRIPGGLLRIIVPCPGVLLTADDDATGCNLCLAWNQVNVWTCSGCLASLDVAALADFVSV